METQYVSVVEWMGPTFSWKSEGRAILCTVLKGIYINRQESYSSCFLPEVSTESCQGKIYMCKCIKDKLRFMSVFLLQMCETELCKSKMYKLEKILKKKKKRK